MKRTRSSLDLELDDIMRDAYNSLPDGERSQQQYVDAAEQLRIDHQIDLNKFSREILTQRVERDIANRAKVIFKIKDGHVDLGSLFPREEAEALVIRLGDGSHVRLIDATYAVIKYRELQQEEAALKSKLSHAGTLAFWEEPVGRILETNREMTFGDAMLQTGMWED